MENNEIEFKVEAWHINGQPNGYKISARVMPVRNTRDEAQPDADAALAQLAFPKSTGIRATTLGGLGEGRRQAQGYLYMNARLAANGTNGGVNETGVRRYRAFRKAAAKAGCTVTFDGRGGNSYKTEAEFEAAIAS